MRKKTISILMLSRWQKFSEPYVIPKVDSPFKRRSVSGRYLPGWTQGVRCEWWWASAFFFCGGYGGKVNDDMKTGGLIELQGVKEEINTIKTELKRKRFDTPKGFSVLEGYIQDRMNELKGKE
ncbi:hypothetical protein [Enterocloster clostridioformis]|uniref:hypothetical protein n=1 Tax=Enterocloster clostridioformis TaxID=1531 RepID=UPI001113A1A0|nr:hypothetical protein [Enterocloster clostridioformis]NSD57643.1 hypothetical protein [Enterocloster clostridioformis]NSJ11657.1 hypothetical protein [Enterocloster clostridioformis]NSJ20518.1 hypothetical protein [Enterocloster clostridioformis]NSJ66014.1 hypothetical protein [Enterocloster clostridioformis]